MALIKCKECEKEISDTAKFCTNCGADQKEKVIFVSKKTALLNWINLFQLFGCIIAGFMNFTSDEGAVLGLLYIVAGIITCGFIRGFTNIIELLDNINNKMS